MSLPNGLNLSLQRDEEEMAAARARKQKQNEKDDKIIQELVAALNQDVSDSKAVRVHTHYEDRWVWHLQRKVYGTLRDVERATTQISKRFCESLPQGLRVHADVEIARGRNCLRIHKENEDGWMLGCALLFMLPAPLIALPILYDRIVKRYIINVTFSIERTGTIRVLDRKPVRA